MPENLYRTIAPRRVGCINWIGLQTLIWKEVSRYLNVGTQTVVAPMVTTLLFFAVFALAFGGLAREIHGISYMEFLAPGLLMMTMVQNAFANTSSSIVVAKVQGNIVDMLMPPISAGEFYIGYVVGGILRGLTVGVASALVMWFFIDLSFYSFGRIVMFAVLGTWLLASMGLAGGIWSQRFDHIAAVTNFIVTPMTFLSGTFYSITQLPEFWQKIALYNPFFYMIDGFRSGFIGTSDGNIMTGIVVLLCINFVLMWLCLSMLKTGYKIKT